MKFLMMSDRWNLLQHFPRLVSAYEDKVLARPNSSPIHRGLMDKYKYRDKYSFANFAQYVLDCAKEQRCRFVSSGCRIDEHIRSFVQKKLHKTFCLKLDHFLFRPFYQQCFYCTMEYDIIGRLEDYHEDILYIAQLRNLTSKLGDLSEVSLSI